MGRNKNDLSAQLQIQLIGFEIKSVPFFLLKVSTLIFFDFLGLILPRNDRGPRAKQKWSEGPSYMLM